ncbi:VanZ family protein [Paenibacillus sp. XY044]|uniref:VanZ family protein n=1 Tax=Paenibacillus sp. XY044 TaxID=2026089 RepID=UPI000B9856F6|nr:VanZ family protein [Paenibacillus sp. XY044]OZB98272.1 teicoplanin resistance protein VanZ [Paenibacillus sp. XY044]
MFHSYVFPISYAFLSFPFVALFFTIPFLVVQYRRHGYINKIRAFVLYLFLLYLLNALFLVILPLPSSRHNPAMAGGALQLVPLNFIHDILKETAVVSSQPSTYLRLLTERAFLQVVFNVFLTIPFGMILRYYFRTGWKLSILLSFLLSLLFETTQLSGIFGLYDHPYRVFDVDDLMTNTLGGLLGFLAAEWLSGLLPRIEQLDANLDLAAKRVTYTRRGIAFMADGIAWAILLGILHVLHVPATFWVTTGLYFMLVPWLSGGLTPGKWLVRIRLTDGGERVSLKSLVIRYGILYWLFFGANRLLAGSMDTVPPILRMILGLIVFAMNTAFFIHVVICVFKKEPQLFYEKMSKTRHVILLQPAAAPQTEQKE